MTRLSLMSSGRVPTTVMTFSRFIWLCAPTAKSFSFEQRVSHSKLGTSGNPLRHALRKTPSGGASNVF
jgi:hypothetical protein